MSASSDSVELESQDMAHANSSPRSLFKKKGNAQCQNRVFYVRVPALTVARNAEFGAAEVPRLELMLIAVGVSTCMLFALDLRQFIDIGLVVLILAAYPPFVRKCRWLLLTALLSTNFWWKVECAVVFACLHAMTAIDWDYVMEKFKNAKAVTI
jgi:hypothetical protein